MPADFKAYAVKPDVPKPPVPAAEEEADAPEGEKKEEPAAEEKKAPEAAEKAE